MSIHLPNNTENEVLLSLFSINGTRVTEKLEKSENGLVKLNMDEIPSGIYTLIISTESSNDIAKIIKK